MAKAQSSNRRRAIEILPPESRPLPTDITESMVREGVAFLEKPFTQQSLATKVRTILDGVP